MGGKILSASVVRLENITTRMEIHMVLEDYLHNDKVLIVAYNGQLTS
jgi:hypothetical protein